MAQGEGLWSRTEAERAPIRHTAASTLFARASFHKKWRGKTITEEQANHVVALMEDTAYASGVRDSLTNPNKPHRQIADEYWR